MAKELNKNNKQKQIKNIIPSVPFVKGDEKQIKIKTESALPL